MKTKKRLKPSGTAGPAVAARCEVGPYRGYMGLAIYETPACTFGGCVLGIDDVVHFEGTTPKEVAAAFRESVDDYLAHCETRGKQPDKPFSGKFVVRLPAEMHRQLSALAEARSASLNSLVVDAISASIGSAG